MILTLQSDFIMLARAKGISPRRVLWVHALRMSMLSLITSVALQMSALIGGAVIAEQFFGPKGIGDRLVFADPAERPPRRPGDHRRARRRSSSLANLVVDLLYAVVDPRIRVARGDSDDEVDQ